MVLHPIWTGCNHCCQSDSDPRFDNCPRNLDGIGSIPGQSRWWMAGRTTRQNPAWTTDGGNGSVSRDSAYALLWNGRRYTIVADVICRILCLDAWYGYIGTVMGECPSRNGLDRSDVRRDGLSEILSHLSKGTGKSGLERFRWLYRRSSG